MGAGQSGGPDITAVVPAQPCVSARCVHLWKVVCPCSPADPEQSQTHTSTGRVPSSSGLAGPYGAGCGEDRLWPAITLAVGLHLPFLGRGAEPQLQSPAGCVREFGAQLLCLALPQPHLLQGPGVGCSGRLPSLLCPLLRGAGWAGLWGSTLLRELFRCPVWLQGSQQALGALGEPVWGKPWALHGCSCLLVGRGRSQ